MRIGQRRTAAAVLGVALLGLSGSSWAKAVKTVKTAHRTGVHAAVVTHKVSSHSAGHGTNHGGNYSPKLKPARGTKAAKASRWSRASNVTPVVEMHGEEVIPGVMPEEAMLSGAAAAQPEADQFAAAPSEPAPFAQVTPVQANADQATAAHPEGKPYWLRMSNLHTGETLEIVYRIGDTYIPEALAKLNYFLRDHNTQDVVTYSPKEFDVLHAMMARLGKVNGLIDVVCGYRTPETNEALRHDAPWTGVAEHSQHMEGHAIDLRVPGVSTAQLRNAALSLHAGGVGYYPVSQFVHIDVGPVREWVFGTKQRRTLMASNSRHRSRRSRSASGM